VNPESSNLLQQLRDIHSAPAAPWWPPAPGWWVLAALLLALLAWLALRLLAAWRVRRRRRQWLQALDQALRGVDRGSQPREFLAILNRAFKRVALSAFPGEHCAGLQGREWVQFVGERLAAVGVSGDLAALADGPYQPAPSFDDEALIGAAREWIRHYG